MANRRFFIVLTSDDLLFFIVTGARGDVVRKDVYAATVQVLGTGLACSNIRAMWHKVTAGLCACVVRGGSERVRGLTVFAVSVSNGRCTV